MDIFILLYLLYVLFSIFSVLWSLNSSLAIIEVAKNILYCFVFLFIISLLKIHKENFLSIFLKTILILFFISFLKITIQFFELPDLQRSSLYYLTGICGHKNLYSNFVFICSIFTFINLYYFHSKWKGFSILAALLQFGIIVMLQTRAVWIGYIVFFSTALILYFLSRIKLHLKFKNIVISILALQILINIFFIDAMPKLLHYYKTHQPNINNNETVNDLSTFSERIEIWQKTYDFFSHNKIKGVGANNWQIYFPSTSLPDVYRITDLNVTFQRPHNDFLWILSEYGLIGFNLYILFLLILLTSLFCINIQKNNFFIIIILSGILGYLTISFFDFPKERIEHNILFFSLLGVAYYYIWKERIVIFKHFFYINKKALVICIIPLLVIILLSILNFRGEYFTKKMYQQRNIRNDNGVIYFCNIAQSFCYNIDATTVPLDWYKGNANEHLRNYSSSLTDFKNSYHVHPYNFNVLNDLASAYYLNNNVDSAKKYYIQSLLINPRFDEPWLNLTAIFINANDYIEAEKSNNLTFHNSPRKNYYSKLIEEHKLLK